MVNLPDLTTYSLDDLDNLRVKLQNEMNRRTMLAGAPAAISRINAQVLSANGIVQGSGWVQPTDATNAYPVGWQVTYNGKTYTSLIPANTTKPGDPTDPQNYRWWKDMSPPPPPPPTGAAAWDGNGHAYAIGDLVSYSGSTYRCIQAHTSQPGWTPTAVPALWTLVSTP